MSICPICSSHRLGEFSTIGLVVDVPRIQCNICDFIFFEGKPENLPVYDVAYNKEFYKPGDIRKTGIFAEILAIAAKNNFCDPEILEVGPGNGLTSYLLEQMGFRVECIEELPEQATFITHNQRLVCHTGKFEYTKIDQEYDIIYAGHVIEHCWDPLHFLQSAFFHLRKNGILYLDTPDAAYAKQYGAGWHHFKTRHPFEHCSIFGIDSMIIAAEKVGFTFKQYIKTPRFQSFQAILQKK